VVYEEEMRRCVQNPWDARNRYIQVVLDRSEDAVRNFFKQVAKRSLAGNERTRVLTLLEMQRHAMFMYTSCGWFFDDIAGIEAIQNLRHAGCALQLARDLCGKDLECEFLETLSHARSNRPEEGDGRRIFENHVKSAEFSGERVVAQAAIGFLFRGDNETHNTGCYSVHRKKHRMMTRKGGKLVMGQHLLFDARIRASETYNFAALYSGDKTIRCGVRANQNRADYQLLVKGLSEIFEKKPFREIQLCFDDYFDNAVFTLSSLTYDERQRILKEILTDTLSASEKTLRRLHAQSRSDIPLISDVDIQLHELILNTQAWVINADLQRGFDNESLEIDKIRALFGEAKDSGVPLNIPTLEHALRCRLEQMTKQLLVTPQDLELLQNLQRAAELIGNLPFPLDQWKIIKNCFQLAGSTYPKLLKLAKSGDLRARKWVSHFQNISDMLSIFIRPR
jgi:hypothetical protein